VGKEAKCQCIWAGESAEVRALLETQELILRGPLRRRIAIASMSSIAVQGEQLIFRVGTDDVALILGREQAQSWAKKLTTPPPALAQKLGVTLNMKVLLLGELESEELRSALAKSAAIMDKATSKTPDLVIASLNSETELTCALPRIAAHPQIPLWIIYPKGAKSSLKESTFRNTLRSLGSIITKFATVSSTFTGLQFFNRS